MSLASAPFALKARAADLAAAAANRSTKGFRVGANEDRRQEELLIMGGRFDLKVSAKDTAGELCLYDTFRPVSYTHLCACASVMPGASRATICMLLLCRFLASRSSLECDRGL